MFFAMIGRCYDCPLPSDPLRAWASAPPAAAPPAAAEEDEDEEDEVDEPTALCNSILRMFLKVAFSSASSATDAYAVMTSAEEAQQWSKNAFKIRVMSNTIMTKIISQKSRIKRIVWRLG